jgi:hypothetical protein
MDLLASIALTIDRFMNSGPPFLLSLIYLTIVAVPLTLVHEMGHALAARRLLGGKVHISVGHAGRVGQFQLGQITASINALAFPARFGGFARFDASRATARDIVVIALCGPLASFLGLLIALPLYSAAAPGTIAHGLLWATVLDSVFAVVLNLIPLELGERRGGRARRNDGGIALDAARAIWAVR